jgi:hypothetical protein
MAHLLLRWYEWEFGISTTFLLISARKKLCYPLSSDLNLNAVERSRGVPYLAIGKHLCGPATGERYVLIKISFSQTLNRTEK